MSLYPTRGPEFDPSKALKRLVNCCIPHRLLGCNYSRVLERDKHLPMIHMNSCLIPPSLKEVIFLHGPLFDDNIWKLDHWKQYEYQLRELLLMHCGDQSGFMFSHGYMLSFLYDILEVGKHEYPRTQTLMCF